MSNMGTLSSKNYGSGAVKVFNFTAPNDPLWKKKRNITSQEPLIFTEWLAEGSLVIHPALTDFKGKNVNSDNYNWEQYINDYRFEATPFIDEAQKELNEGFIQNENGTKNKYADEFTEVVQQTIINEIKKTFK